MEQDPKEIRSRQDEVNYIKNIEIAEQKNRLNDRESQNKKQKNQMSNYQSLAQQLQEKELYQKNVKMQESAIANYYSKEADKYRMEIEDEKAKKQRQKEEYYKALSNQIHENQKKKQYSVLMSEHERRVNDRDIQAYEKMDSKNLYSKVVGFGGDERLDKYIDKSVMVKSPNNSPNQTSSKAANLQDSNSAGNSNLARMGQMSLEQPKNIINGAPQNTGVKNNSYSMNKLLKVRDNMQKEDAFKYRANTNNRGYGFVQAIQKNPPQVKQIPEGEDINPYEYNYSAPANY